MPEQTPTVGMERKLAMIFSAAVAGYRRLMGDDEEALIRNERYAEHPLQLKSLISRPK